MLPFVLLVTVILTVSLGAILSGVLSVFEEREENKKFSIALTGDTDNEYLSFGIAAMTNFDETRFSIDFLEMEEGEARKALEGGKISAYVILPDNFIDNALSGKVEPIQYVTTPGMEGINTLFKKEITSLVTDIVVYSEKGTYGLYDALNKNGYNKTSGKHVDELALEYVELIFKRNELYSVEETGVSDGLTTPEYYISAMTVVLLTLIGIPFGVAYIKKDMAFSRLCASRGHSAFSQVLCEGGALFALMLLLAVPILIACSLIPDFEGGFILKSIFAIIMLTAFNMLIFEASDNVVSGLLLHFFLFVGFCYISGCFYPVSAFPEGVRTVASLLPTGVLREYLATSFNNSDAFGSFAGIVIYCVVFFLITVFLRKNRITGVRV